MFALIAEIPFNFMVGGSFIYPFHQNVLWTFLMALGLMCMLEKAKNSKRKWLYPVFAAISCLLAYLMGVLTMADYYGGGVLTVLVFYFFNKKKLVDIIGQIITLLYINWEMLGGFGYDLNVLGFEFFFPIQAIALLALVPIWLYQGRKGHSSKAFKYTCYAFYPGHMLALYLIALLMHK